MTELVLGPMLRYIGATDATVWVETDGPCQVEILERRVATFRAEGHHYAVVPVTGLDPGSTREYEVRLDGEWRWPPNDHGDLPRSRIRTPPQEGPIDLVFGSCRVTAPHSPPYALAPDEHKQGFGVDALYALALRLRDQDTACWPQMLLLLGDQVYADEVSPDTLEFIRSRRDVGQPPGEEVADFEEYTRLYREAWAEPTLRWLFSTIPTAMIFDDHDVHDDWNTSELWIERMRAQPWWDRRITSALSTYWIYQHLGNLSPAELEADKLLQRVIAAEDAGPILHEFALAAEQEGGGSLWSFARDLGSTRLVVLDGREGRVLSEGRREMLDEQEWRWFEKQLSGNFDHLLIANTLPVLLPPNFHHLEAWNEAVCAGAWGKVVARWGERLREALDLEQWAAFHDSFHRLIALVGEVATGQHGTPPVTIAFLGGDVHQAYLHQATFRSIEGVRSALYQVVCSPFRNPLDRRERALLNGARRSRVLGWIIRRLARAARVREPEIRWRLREEPTFDNQLALLHLHGPRSSLRIERTHPGESTPHLETALEAQLA